jgi:hypothetical protein
MLPRCGADTVRTTRASRRGSGRMVGMVALEELEDLRRRAEGSVTAEEAVDLNARIVALATSDGAALNRLGRAYEFLGYHEKAIKAFEDAFAIAPPNTLVASIAQGRLRTLRGLRATGARRRGAPAAVEPRDPEQALAVFDAESRPGCVQLLADLLRFSRRVDREWTIVRDVAPDNYFYVAGGAHASAGPWNGLMDCYADERGIDVTVVERVVQAGGLHRPATGTGHAPYSLRLQIPFELIGDLRPALLPAMRDHIKRSSRSARRSTCTSETTN